MSVKNVSHHLTIEVLENINQTFCGGQVVGVKYIILYHIYNNGKYSKEYSVLNTNTYIRLNRYNRPRTRTRERDGIFKDLLFLPTAEKVVEI